LSLSPKTSSFITQVHACLVKELGLHAASPRIPSLAPAVRIEMKLHLRRC
jgi:hypothetical protein